MVNQAKIYAVENLTAQLKDSKAFFLVNYQGIDAGSLNKLRQQIKESGGELIVVKNTLLRQAIKALGRFQGWKEEELSGPTACLLDKEGSFASLKEVAKALENEDVFKGGILAERAVFLEGPQVAKIAQLPDRDELLGKLIGLLKGPEQHLLTVLTGSMRQLVLLLMAIKDKGNEGKEVKN